MGVPFFFILGRPRSGTTLLKTLFDAHPNVKIPPELPIFLPLYQKFKHVKKWDRAEILSFVDHVFQPNVFNNRRLENLKIDRELFTADLLKLENNCTIQDLLIKLNEHSYSVFPKQEIRLVGDKNPVYSVYMKRLIRIFPKAWFICIIRDYRDNYVSLKNLQEVKLEPRYLRFRSPGGSTLLNYSWRARTGSLTGFLLSVTRTWSPNPRNRSGSCAHSEAFHMLRRFSTTTKKRMSYSRHFRTP